MAFYNVEVKPNPALLYLIKGLCLFHFRLKTVSLFLTKGWTIVIDLLHSRLGTLGGDGYTIINISLELPH